LVQNTEQEKTILCVHIVTFVVFGSECCGGTSWNVVFAFSDPRAAMPSVFFHLLTTWSRALLEKLTGYQLVKIFPAFY
jgi:hypothetical protein